MSEQKEKSSTDEEKDLSSKDTSSANSFTEEEFNNNNNYASINTSTSSEEEYNNDVVNIVDKRLPLLNTTDDCSVSSKHSVPEDYFSESPKHIVYYKDSNYEQELKFGLETGECSLFAQMKAYEKDRKLLINKENSNNAKFYFACEVKENISENIILSIKHRDLVGSDKIALMVCVQGFDDSRKLSIICLEKDWFEYNCQSIYDQSEIIFRCILVLLFILI